MSLTDRIIKISVRNLVEFIFKTGDINTGLGMGQDIMAMQEGAKIHRMLQKEAGECYHAEVSLKVQIERQTDNNIDYQIQLEGRADGIIYDLDKPDNSNVCIDEIKTMQSDINMLKEPIYVHKAQAMCYGYMYLMQNHLENIDIRLTYCNSQTREIKQYTEHFTAAVLIDWFDNVIETFSKWIDFLLKHKQSRKSSIVNLQFPYDYRPGQRNLVVSVYKAIQQKRNLYIQASTGVGKTLSTIFPTVAAMGQDYVDKIFYLTSKTITRTVAQNTYKLLQENGLCIKTVTLTAKEKICFDENCRCNPLECPYAKGHFDRINDAVYNIIAENNFIDRECVEKYAMKYQVCPFEMQLDISNWCDSIICDYNYVFDPSVGLKRYFSDGVKGDYAFLVDEAHNLVDRARQMYSAVLVKEEFLKIKRMLSTVSYGTSVVRNLEKCNKELLMLKRQCDTYRVISDAELLGRLPEYLSCLAAELSVFFEKYKTYPEKDTLLEFYFHVKFFMFIYDKLDNKYQIYTEHDDNGNFCVCLFCVDPSNNIAQCLEMGRSTIFFSATLLPVNYFKEMLSGEVSDYAVYAESSFDDDNRCVVVASDVSSRYARRNNTEYQKICAYIYDTVTAHDGKYMVYFPSYSYMNEVTVLYERLYLVHRLQFEESESINFNTNDNKDTIENAKLHLVVQENNMKEAQKEWFLRLFDEGNYKGSLVGFCVIGGAFSEGIDLREESLIGVIIVGTGLPMICRQRNILREYFDSIGKDGFSYAYLYPGMNKVLQAAGRVIRTASDKGIIELLDNRLLRDEYQSLYPKEWKQVYTVSQSQIKNILLEFWKNVVQYKNI
ncbi:MAG: ATP-dependent DNA helicase [Lachnospira sp.]|nr:ATP-dependent DNA helicase [Lachnospira sp.]